MFNQTQEQLLTWSEMKYSSLEDEKLLSIRIMVDRFQKSPAVEGGIFGQACRCAPIIQRGPTTKIDVCMTFTHCQDCTEVPFHRPSVQFPTTQLAYPQQIANPVFHVNSAPAASPLGVDTRCDDVTNT